MRESINFSFDGIASEDMGVYIVHEGGGLFEENFLPNRSIIETKSANRNKPYFQRVESEPLEFELSFFIEQWEDRNNIRQVARWLFKDFYKPLTFESNPDRIFYAIVHSNSSLLHNGRKEGYVKLMVRCDSPYSYSHPTLIEDIESSYSSFSILNSGDVDIKPKMWITKTVSEGNISLTMVESDQTFKLSNLALNEEVFIDNEHEELISNLENLGVYRYSNHNGEWLTFSVDENTLLMQGDFKISIEYQSIYLAD
ncbi:distal tail protein Dit [Planococcus halocryophilus]|uniref:distal tail protein Dit n=1 Tax=Planococcus halocryophilus TaxID=1215089 RepID=UPI001F115CA2|nr:distal tail protein Dit [Planococcus halocryophilus]MCH4825792.1 phage tail family protein [Planococcus halocryophilus]